MNNLALKKKCPRVQGKFNWPGLYCSLICIEPKYGIFCICQIGGCSKPLCHSIFMCKCFCLYW